MSIKLKDEETIIASAQFHWSTYILPSVWGAFVSLFLIVRIMNSDLGGAFVVVLIGWTPLVYKTIQNKFKLYIITNNRLYIEEGVFRKSTKDIHAQKINNVELKQGIVQRIFGAGDILVFTGNDNSTKLKNVDDVEKFKNYLSTIKS